MTKFFKFMDHLPIVRMLQVFAVFYFILTCILQFKLHFQMHDFTATRNADLDKEWNVFWSSILAMFQTVFTQGAFALVLLALAEIIKLMKQKQKINDVEDVQ